MYDLNLPNCTQTQSPNRKEFVSKVLPQLTGLQELAREKEIMGGSDVSTENAERFDKEEVKDGSRESDERKEAIKRLKTSKEKVVLCSSLNQNSRLQHWTVSPPEFAV